jgi:ketosteroid isomerase-like protein
MTRWLNGALVAAAFVTTLVTAQERISPELQALADAERAFAKAATVKGIRDSFLEFFAEDSIALRPDAKSAKEELRGRQSFPFAVRELTWEPRTGDIAASGEIGWLTGPSTFIDHGPPGSKPSYGNYLSVWRKQPDGQWRVYIDVGATTPQPVSFAPGFVRFPLTSRYTGKDGKAAASKTLLAADRAVNERFARGTAAAYADRLTPASRLHRPGFVSLVGVTPIQDWLSANAPAMTALTGTGEASNAGDLGYTYGVYELKGKLPPENGAYVRVWFRDASGKWWMVADVTQPVR